MAYGMMWGTGFEQRSNEIFLTADRNGFGILTGTSSRAAHSGACYGDLSDNGDYFILRPGGFHNDLYFGAWVYLFVDQDFDIYFYDQGGDFSRLRYNFSTGFWQFYVDTALTATSTIRVNSNSWQNIQIHLRMASTGAGVFQLKLNGYTAINYSGQTVPGFNAFYDRIKVQDFVYIDDVTYGSGSWPGDIRFERLKVTADSTPSEWGYTGSSSAWRAISSDRYTTSSYITTSTDGKTAMFQLADWDSFNKIPKAIVGWIRALKAEATLDYIRIMCRTSNMATGTLEIIDAAGSFNSEIFPIDPGDGGDWSATGVNMAEIGVQSYYVVS